MLGNADLPHRPTVRGFAEGLGWLAQIGLFVLLGLLVSPAGLLAQVVPALVIGTVLLLVARPLSVVASVSWLGYSWRDQAFLSWAGLRGAVPIVLATVPVQLAAPGTEGLFELVFVLVVVFTLVQAPTLPRVARRLRLAADTPQDLEVESSPLGAIDAQVLTVGVGPASKLHGMELFELRLPKGAAVSLVVRDGTSFVPQPGTRLRRGDQLMVICPGPVRRVTERRLHVLSEQGRLAQWRGGTPDARSRRHPAPARALDAGAGSRNRNSDRPARVSIGTRATGVPGPRAGDGRGARPERQTEGAHRADVRLRLHRLRQPVRGAPVVHRRRPHRVPRVRRADPQAVQLGRHRVQGLRLLPHRLARRLHQRRAGGRDLVVGRGEGPRRPEHDEGVRLHGRGRLERLRLGFVEQHQGVRVVRLVVGLVRRVRLTPPTVRPPVHRVGVVHSPPVGRRPAARSTASVPGMQQRSPLADHRPVAGDRA